MDKERLISEILLLPQTAIEYHLSKQLAELFPTKALIEGDIGNFDVQGYAAAGHCTLTGRTFSYNQVLTHWTGREPEMMQWQYMGVHPGQHMLINGMPMTQPPSSEKDTADIFKRAWLEVQWQGHEFDVLLMLCNDGQFNMFHHWILADTQEIARGFLAAVCEWSTEIRGEVLVFDNGHWYKDEHLFRDIKNATFDNLILKGSLKQDIRDDITQFFAARPTYEECGVPWKRGILFVGPPGNGKTHAVKALINSLNQPCLYVKSFRTPHGGPDEMCIRLVFDRARTSAPCVLVLEDLDSLVTAQNRSFFLNELDGFAANIGIVALATTNHPERLDPAILDRPSRFDRKYPFELPVLSERRSYITLWNDTLKPALRLSDEGVEKVSAHTEEFSFAYLKELFLSSMMRWISSSQQGSMDEVMLGQASVLREQMMSAIALPEMPDQMDEQSSMSPRFSARMIRQGHFRGGM
ncbi:MAG TPA: ATP-binding protein [Ktedonobacteraceae bacterium]|jgi:DNA polymerase III delta prime subunit